jgi:hypothetical protein
MKRRGFIKQLAAAPILTAPLLTFLLRRAVGGSVLAGFLVAKAVSAFISYSKQLFGFEQNISFMWVVPGSFAIGVITTGIVSQLFTPTAQPALGELALEREPLP